MKLIKNETLVDFFYKFSREHTVFIADILIYRYPTHFSICHSFLDNYYKNDYNSYSSNLARNHAQMGGLPWVTWVAGDIVFGKRRQIEQVIHIVL
jgi:hypothetical protein